MQGELDDATSALWNLRHLFSFRFCVTARRKRNGSGCRFDVECNVGAAAGPGTRGTSALPYGRGRAARNGRAKGARRGAGRGRAGRRGPRGATSNGYPMHSIEKHATEELPEQYVRFAANETDRDQL
jgi:hypothetical protein